MDHEYFDGVVDFLESKDHPEMHHLKSDSHPGTDWYLKTICPAPELPHIDKYGYGLLWQTLAEDYSNIVKIIPEAYDWEGEKIPYMVSVWINIEHDVLLRYTDGIGFDIAVIDRESGLSLFVNNLGSHIRSIRENVSWGDNPSETLKELDRIDNILDHIQSKINDDPNNEKHFKVIDGGKNDKT